MIRRLFDPLFICYGLLWLQVYGFRKAGVIIPVFNDYLTDLIAVNAIAHLTIFIIRSKIVRNHSYDYPFGYVLFIAVYLSVVFEWLMPRFSPVYTGDPGDMIAYGCGGINLLFRAWENENRQKRE